jgi:phage repressor protein C with HTH and peptisase S24 domain
MVYLCTMLSLENIYETLETRRKELGLSQAEVSARAFGRADNSAFQGIRRGAWPSVQKLEALATALGLEYSFGQPKTRNKSPEVVVRIDSQDYASIPLYGVEASAGPGAENHGAEIVDELAFQRAWLRKMNVRPADACLMRVRGDSMTPGLRDGDVVLVNRGRTSIRNGRVYAFVDLDQQARIKRLERLDDSTLLIRSDNPDHTSELRRGTDMNRVEMIGEVVWSGHNWTS